MPSAKTEKSEWKKATLGNLPPLCAPIQDQSIVGVIESIDVDDSGDRRRYFYRVTLDESTKGIMNADKDEETYEAGTLVSVPGSGSLDYQMKVIALKIEGKIPENAGPTAISELMDDLDEDDIKMALLVGHRVKILRGEDDKMPAGKWKGKTVKTFQVEYQ